MAVWIGIGTLLALALLAAGMSRGLRICRQRVESAWTHLEGQLRRRGDLVVRLVEAFAHRPDGAEARQEAATARQAALDARAIPERYEAENQLTEASRRLFALAPTDPDPGQEPTLGALEQELTTTEEGIAAACRAYNDAVMALNTRRHRFPWSLVAGRTPPGEYFIIDDPAHR